MSLNVTVISIFLLKQIQNLICSSLAHTVRDLKILKNCSQYTLSETLPITGTLCQLLQENTDTLLSGRIIVCHSFSFDCDSLSNYMEFASCSLIYMAINSAFLSIFTSNSYRIASPYLYCGLDSF